MKRYWLFLYQQYYPSGGMLDFYTSFDTQKEAAAFINENMKKPNISLNNELSYLERGDGLANIYFQIFDSKERKIVEGGQIIHNSNTSNIVGRFIDENKPEWYIDRSEFEEDELKSIHQRFK